MTHANSLVLGFLPFSARCILFDQPIHLIMQRKWVASRGNNKVIDCLIKSLIPGSKLICKAMDNAQLVTECIDIVSRKRILGHKPAHTAWHILYQEGNRFCRDILVRQD